MIHSPISFIFIELYLYKCIANCTADAVRLHLVDGKSEGLVEVCLGAPGVNSYWAGVCYDQFQLSAARVLCRNKQLLTENTTGNSDHCPVILRLFTNKAYSTCSVCAFTEPS